MTLNTLFKITADDILYLFFIILQRKTVLVFHVAHDCLCASKVKTRFFSYFYMKIIIHAREIYKALPHYCGKEKRLCPEKSGVWSGSTLFANTYSNILDNQEVAECTILNFRRCMVSRQSVPILRVNMVPYLPYVFGQTGLSKQYRPRWDAAERGVSSGSTLFATHPATFRHNIR